MHLAHACRFDEFQHAVRVFHDEDYKEVQGTVVSKSCPEASYLRSDI